MRRLLLVTVLLGLSAEAGCMPASYRRARRLEGRYDVGDPGKGWEKLKPGGADHAWRQKGTGAVVYTDSNCGPRFQDVPVDVLATEMETPLGEKEVLVERTVPLAGREGAERVLLGKLDGVPTQLRVLVLNRDECTYDFVLISPPEAWEGASAALDEVVAGFRPR